MSRTIVSETFGTTDGRTFKKSLTYANEEQNIDGYYQKVKAFTYAVYPVEIEDCGGYQVVRTNAYSGFKSVKVLPSDFRISDKKARESIPAFEDWIDRVLSDRFGTEKA